MIAPRYLIHLSGEISDFERRGDLALGVRFSDRLGLLQPP